MNNPLPVKNQKKYNWPHISFVVLFYTSISVETKNRRKNIISMCCICFVFLQKKNGWVCQIKKQINPTKQNKSKRKLFVKLFTKLKKKK